MLTIDIDEAKAHSFELVEQAAGGKSFLIAISGQPKVVVMPVGTSEVGRMRGLRLLERAVCAAEEFDQRITAVNAFIDTTMWSRFLRRSERAVSADVRFQARGDITQRANRGTDHERLLSMRYERWRCVMRRRRDTMVEPSSTFKQE